MNDDAPLEAPPTLTHGDGPDAGVQELANPLATQLGHIRRASPGVLIVFGATGDLCSRKLLPALERLSSRRLLPSNFALVGVARSEMEDGAFRSFMAGAVKDPTPSWESLVSRSRYVSGDFSDPITFEWLRSMLDDLDRDLGTGGNHTFYLATVPSTFEAVTDNLRKVGLNQPRQDGAAVRIVIEKPFGRDLASATHLDAAIHNSFEESQIYRIDHYLGKETVQNVLALRFANAIFEPLWNRSYLDHVQITVAESIGVEGRAAFYETAGALRDIVQNHVMQVLAMTLMEPPGAINSNGIRDEKVKALRAVVIPTPDQVVTETVRAQYDSGWSDGNAVSGYRQEPDVSPRSQTETYVAMKLMVDNWRWAGVPIYVRTGKRLPKRITEVALQFQKVPHLSFSEAEAQGLHPNALILRIQPDEGVMLRFGAKVPGQTFRVRDVLMAMSYGTAFLEEAPEAYERLLLDALIGDSTLFIRSDEVDQAWQIVEPILSTWEERSTPPLAGYAAGTWGPRQADKLIERDGRQWRNP